MHKKEDADADHTTHRQMFTPFKPQTVSWRRKYPSTSWTSTSTSRWWRIRPLGRLWKEMGYFYKWHTCEHPQVTKDGVIIKCHSEDDVQDVPSHWIQSHPVKCKNAAETLTCSQRFCFLRLSLGGSTLVIPCVSSISGSWDVHATSL